MPRAKSRVLKRSQGTAESLKRFSDQQHTRHKEGRGRVNGLLFERRISAVERRPRPRRKGPAGLLFKSTRLKAETMARHYMATHTQRVQNKALALLASVAAAVLRAPELAAIFFKSTRRKGVEMETV